MVRLALLLVLALAACDRGERPPSGADVTLAEVSIDELAALLADGEAEPVDANGNATRARQGVIPGATLLSDYRRYAIGELPADKATKLVFYCANEQCGASHEAARRAVRAGYADVAVLPAGIAGWRGAGREVETRQ